MADKKTSCKSCKKRFIKDSSCISCDACAFWWHIRCADVSEAVFQFLSNNGSDGSILWLCTDCKGSSTVMSTKVWSDFKNDIKEIVGNCSANVSAVDRKVDDLIVKVDDYNSQTNSEIDRLEKIVRNGELIIRRIPATLLKTTEEIVLAVASFLEVHITTNDILDSFWLKRNVTQNDTRTYSDDSILVRVTPRSKQLLMKQYFAKMDNCTLNKIFADADVSSRFYLNESLASAARTLVREANTLTKNKRIKSFYTRNGCVYVIKLDDSKMKVNSINDLLNL